MLGINFNWVITNEAIDLYRLGQIFKDGDNVAIVDILHEKSVNVYRPRIYIPDHVKLQVMYYTAICVLRIHNAVIPFNEISSNCIYRQHDIKRELTYNAMTEIVLSMSNHLTRIDGKVSDYKLDCFCGHTYILHCNVM